MRRLIGVLLLLPLSLWADTKETLDFLFSVKQVKETAISPDGQRVGWVEAQINKDRTESSNSFIYVRDPRAQTPRRVTAGKGDPLIEKSLAWSPDSTRLAFLSGNQKEKQLQLWLVPAAGGAPQKSTELKGHLANPRWSPDGKTIALLVIADVTRESGPLAAAKHDTGEVEEVVAEQRVVLVDVGSGKTRAITPPDTYVYEYDWSPDGRDIAYTAAKGVGDNNWWIAKLYTMDVDSLVLREVYKPETQIAVPRWSPDGKTIAFVQGLMSDEGSTGGDIWTVSSKGGEARNLTQGRKSSAA
ncbi:MAG TPA: hypothetical protein VKC60_06310, partial [Opitutaceae bacterium]|nr:hypothetical protein [Opitutaceae bacterium]